MTNLVGRQIGSYRIDALLGEGGMGAVYRAFDLNLARPVALKVMHTQFAHQPEFQRRFQQEAQAAARLSDHPSIINIYNFGGIEDLFYMVMEFVPGTSLNGYIKHVQETNQMVKISDTLLILAQVADALGHAHKEGVIHRDVKPDNVLIKPLDHPDREGDLPIRAIVTDFGLAKLLEGGVQTQTGTFMGTLPYMSPEQCLGRNLDGRSDLYSLGVMLYQLATGQLPFDIKSPTEAVMKHVNEAPRPPQEIRPGVPASVAKAIEKSIAKNPNERYQSGEDMASDLRHVAAGLSDADVTRYAPANTVISLVTQLVPQDAGIEPSRMGYDLTALPGMTRVLIAQKGVSPQSYNIEKNLVTIGRGSDNDIVLAAQGVSRNHARIERASAGGFTVTDLGSTNGTYLADSQLLPDLPEIWEPGETLRIGPFFLRLQQEKSVGQPAVGPAPTYQGAIAAPVGGTLVKSSSGRLSLVVNPTNVEVPAGGRTDLQLEMLNQGTTVDHFKVEMQGLPASWVVVGRESVQLMPGAGITVPVTVQPPMDSSAAAGEHPYRVIVSSIADLQEKASVSGKIKVLPFSRFKVDMRPLRIQNKGIARVLVQNNGNAEEAYSVVARDQAEAVQFRGQQGRLKVGAGQKGTVDIEISPKSRPKFGSSRSFPFEVLVGTSSQDRQRLAGNLDVRPVFPAWLLPLFGVLAVILCLSLGGLYAFWNNRNNEADRQQQTATAEVVAAIMTTEAQETLAARQTAEAEGFSAATATSQAMTAEAQGDNDEDGLSNSRELILGTDPENPDTDGDGLSDGQEVNEHGTNPLKQDTDGDNLTDGAEVNEYGTSPNNPDTDSDGITDGVEVSTGGNPLALPTATATNSPTPSATPSITPTPSPTLTPTPTTGQFVPVFDRYWPLRSTFLILCIVGEECPTATPLPKFGHTPQLILETNTEPCPLAIICLDGLAAIRFDYGSIPPGSDIQQARLILTLESGLTAGAEIEVGRAIINWTEDSDGRPECNFDQSVTRVVDLSPGAYEWDLTDMVRDQHANPANNFGFCLQQVNDGSRTFTSREGLVNDVPRMEIIYQP